MADETAHPDERPAEARPRWYALAVPVTGLVLALVAVVALVIPGVRDQLALSLSRQPDPYVELSFTRPGSGPQTLCHREKGTAVVRFGVASHLRRAKPIAYRVGVAPAGGKVHFRDGKVRVATDRARAVVARFAVPAGPYRMAVRLPASEQKLWATCGGPR